MNARADAAALTPADLVRNLADPMWRLCSGALYKILIKGDKGEDGLVLSFVPNRAQRRFIKRLHHRNIILKARQLGFCVSPETRVLTAGLRWKPIAELREGEEVVAVDEHPPGGRGKARRMRTATVQAVARVQRMAFRITFDDGRQVVCTDRHPWLSKKAGDMAEWRSLCGQGNSVVGRLKVGTKVRWIAKPWDEPSFEDGWMGGMIDGEGSMALPNGSGAEINVSQVQGPAFARMEMYLSTRGYNYRTEHDTAKRSSKLGSSPVDKLCVSRIDEVFRLVGQTRPIRFVGRQFWDGKELPGKRNGDVGWATITSIEPVGEQTMIDLQTSTGTYIAEGFVSHNTTLIAIVWLDHALFNPNARCGIIAQDREAAEVIFRDKVKFAWENLPPALKAAMPLARDSAAELLFGHNNSSIRVATSMRSGTIHRLHISEFGKICAKFPEKAAEVVTGSIPAVPKNGVLIIESTAEGREGEFYDMVKRSRALQDALKPLTERDYRFHFFPWYDEPGYRMDPAGVTITAKDHEYFDSIEAAEEVSIDQEQRAWYVATRDADFAGAEEKMWQEYPSTPDEAFQKSTEGCYYTAQLTAARKEKRICRLPTLMNVPCLTFWDIGNSDGCAIWVLQRVGHENRWVRFYEAWNEPYSHAVKWLKDTGLIFDKHYLPHDADHVRQGQTTNKSPKQMLEELLPGAKFEIVERIQDVNWGIQQTRDAFPTYFFDEEHCKAGIIHVESYRKKWNTRQGCWSDEPSKEGGHSEAADSLRQHGQALAAGLIQTSGQNWKRKTTNWRTT